MAILDTSISGSSIVNRDSDVFIGIDLPFYKSNGTEGYFASTKITLHSVKNNLINLLKTQKGERYLQPRLGLNLRNLLFEPITTDTQDEIESEIILAISTWLPFVKIQIDLTFSLTELPNMLDSIQIEI